MFEELNLQERQEKAVRLREQAAHYRKYAMYADGQAYQQDLEHANSCIKLAKELEESLLLNEG